MKFWPKSHDRHRKASVVTQFGAAVRTSEPLASPLLGVFGSLIAMATGTGDVAPAIAAASMLPEGYRRWRADWASQSYLARPLYLPRPAGQVSDLAKPPALEESTSQTTRIDHQLGTEGLPEIASHDLPPDPHARMLIAGDMWWTGAGTQVGEEKVGAVLQRNAAAASGGTVAVDDKYAMVGAPLGLLPFQAMLYRDMYWRARWSNEPNAALVPPSVIGISFGAHEIYNDIPFQVVAPYLRLSLGQFGSPRFAPGQTESAEVLLITPGLSFAPAIWGSARPELTDRERIFGEQVERFVDELIAAEPHRKIRVIRGDLLARKLLSRAPEDWDVELQLFPSAAKQREIVPELEPYVYPAIQADVSQRRRSGEGFIPPSERPVTGQEVIEFRAAQDALAEQQTILATQQEEVAARLAALEKSGPPRPPKYLARQYVGVRSGPGGGNRQRRVAGLPRRPSS